MCNENQSLVNRTLSVQEMGFYFQGLGIHTEWQLKACFSLQFLLILNGHLKNSPILDIILNSHAS